MPKNAAMMSVIHAVQRQPRYDCVMNPPMMGPAMGPMNVAPAKTHTATPRSTGPKKSAREPPTIASGAEAKAPPKKRQSMIVSRLTATATGIWKTANRK